jgi:hypothetical protein
MKTSDLETVTGAADGMNDAVVISDRVSGRLIILPQRRDGGAAVLVPGNRSSSPRNSADGSSSPVESNKLATPSVRDPEHRSTSIDLESRSNTGYFY